MKVRIEEITHVQVNARRWFDKQNTYHTVDVKIYSTNALGERTYTHATSPFTYGYGDAWKQTACIFVNACIVAPSPFSLPPSPFSRDTQGARYTVGYDDVDVTRKSDLHRQGKVCAEGDIWQETRAANGDFIRDTTFDYVGA